MLRGARVAVTAVMGSVALGCSGGDGVTVACGAGGDVLAVTRVGASEGLAEVVVSLGERAERVTGDWVATGPSFSPDGRFVVVRASGDYESAGPDGTTLWVLGAGGADPRRLTDGPFDDEPDWSPDGEQIAYSAGPSIGGRPRQVLSVPSAGGHPRALVADGPGDDHAPAWSPDGERIAWIRSGRDGSSSVWVSDADGGRARMVVDSVLGGGHSLDWHPGGRTLLLNTDDGMFLVDVARGDLDLISGGLFGAWSPDGSSVYYLSREGDAGSSRRLARGRIVDGRLERERFMGGAVLTSYPYPYLGVAVRPCDAARAPAGPGP